ncbi:VOC family protein [Oceanobacillus senegalensis]|uniref:VOC family protein n=1 Tax=Oceanobacillus senegalensis TaxID=1936063 RepID=UPI000A30B3DF|nr:VOC family protein [Oceanobacillus senegalensis]
MIKIKNVFYRVSNMKETSEFYQEVLGLPLQFVDRDQWAQFKVNGVTFALGGREEVPHDLEAGAVVTFEVENLNEARKQLEQHDVQVSDVRDMGGHGSTCYFLDPSKNIVQLYQK